MDVCIQTCVDQFLTCVVVIMQLSPLSPWVHLLYVYNFSHTWTYVYTHILTYPPLHTHSYTCICNWNTDMHFYIIAQCTMVKNVPCAWQFISKASSNTLCTLIVQTNSSTCNYETSQRRSGQFDNTAGPHFSLGLRNYHWSTSSRKQH